MKYRDFEITTNIYNSAMVAIHDAFEADYDEDGVTRYSHPIIEQGTVQECKNEIDDWYAETGGEAWK